MKTTRTLDILIANNGLAAIKFIHSIRDWSVQRDIEVIFWGICTQSDKEAKYKYLEWLKGVYCYEDYLAQLKDTSGVPNNPFLNANYVCDVAQQIQREVKARNGTFLLWPGWGYLSEDADFVRSLENLGIKFVGPCRDTIHMLGDKLEATKLTKQLKLRIPETLDIEFETTSETSANVEPQVQLPRHIDISNMPLLSKFGDDEGYPLLVKYSGGGGGRGQRIVEDSTGFTRAVKDVCDEVLPGASQQERLEFFKGKLFVMKYIRDCFHLEVQFVSDGKRFAHLWGRDCSIQRRKQKLIEEAPIPGLPPGTMEKMIEDTKRLVVNEFSTYVGVGTAEYLYDKTSGNVYFLEVNPRLQVEHLISEHLFDTNIPAIQVQIALGVPLSDIPEMKSVLLETKPAKHVIAARINSENFFNSFQSSVGKVHAVSFTPYTFGYVSINNDSVISTSSDSQIGHVFAVGNTREIARKRLVNCLQDFVLDGHIFNTTQLLRHILSHEDFIQRSYSTTWLETELEQTSFLDILIPTQSIHPVCCALYRTMKEFRHLIQERRRLLNNGHTFKKSADGLKNVFKVDISYRNVTFTLDLLRDTKYDVDDNVQYFVVRDGRNTNYFFSIEQHGKDYYVTHMGSNSKAKRLFHVIIFQDDDMGTRLSINHTTAWFPYTRDPNTIFVDCGGRFTPSVSNGTHVSPGDVIGQLEVMKMLQSITTSRAGVINFEMKTTTNVVTGQAIAKLTLPIDAAVKEESVETVNRVNNEGCALLGLADSSDNDDPRVVSILESHVDDQGKDKPSTTHKRDGLSSDTLEGRKEKVRLLYNSTYVYTMLQDIVDRMSETEYEVESQELDLVQVLDQDQDQDSPDLVERSVVPIVRDPGNNNLAMVAWRVNIKRQTQVESHFYVVGNDITKYNGSFGVDEDNLWAAVASLAEGERVPLIYLSCNSGARMTVHEELLGDVKVCKDSEDGSDPYLYLDKKDAEKYQARGDVCTEDLDNGHSRLVWIRNKVSSAEVLDGSGKIASAMSKAYASTFTLTYVTGRSVGIGAYVAKLGGRIIQRKASSILLTGHRALNELLGSDLYISDQQIGGTNVMHCNGITDVVVSDDDEGMEAITKWLSYSFDSVTGTWALLGKPCQSPMSSSPNSFELEANKGVDNTTCLLGKISTRQLLGKIADKGSFMETLNDWGKSVVTGRMRVGGRAYAIVAGNTETSTRLIPADPGDRESKEMPQVHSGEVLYPDSSSKVAKTIRDAKLEGLPIVIVANWRGFSGGTRDMYDEILTCGSEIVEALTFYDRPITIWVPPHSQLRGGAYVVFSKQINSRWMTMLMDPTSRVGVLEPQALQKVRIKSVRKYGSSDTTLGEQLGFEQADKDDEQTKEQLDKLLTSFCDMHDLPQGNQIPTATLDDLVAKLKAIN